VTAYLELADYLLIAERVLGLPAQAIANFDRIGLAEPGTRRLSPASCPGTFRRRYQRAPSRWGSEDSGGALGMALVSIRGCCERGAAARPASAARATGTGRAGSRPPRASS